MSYLLNILALLSQLQNTQLVQDVEGCVLTNTSASSIWQCILGKLQTHPHPTPTDAVRIDAAKALALQGKL